MLCHNTEAVMASIRGQVYEAYVHREFKRLSNQQRSVVALFPEKPSQNMKLPFPKLTASEVFDDLKGLSSGVYGIPRSRSFASVDAVIGGKHRIALQMSVSAEHGYKVEGLKNIRNSLNLNDKDPLRVVLVTPADVTNVRFQTYVNHGRVVHEPKLGKVLQYWMVFPWEVNASEP